MIMPEDVQNLLNETVRYGGAPGVVVGVNFDGHRSFYAAGLRSLSSLDTPSAESRIRPGCIAKVLTAIVALELMEEGKLDFQAPIEEYLPELRGTFVGRHVRASHLISHSSGYRGPNIADPVVRHYFNWEQLVSLLFEDEQLFEPGSQFNYEHTESVLLGEIAGRIAGADILELHHSRLLSRLGISGAGPANEVALELMGEHSIDPKTHCFQLVRPWPPSPFWRASLQDTTNSVAELLQIAEACAGLDANGVLQPKTVSLLRKTFVSLPAGIGGQHCEDIPISFGFGYGRYGRDTYGHNGSSRGQTCSLRYNLRSGAVAAVALNAWRPIARDVICRKVMSESGPWTASSTSVWSRHWNPKALSGHYHGARGTEAEVRERNGQLNLFVHSPHGCQSVTATVEHIGGRLKFSSSVPILTVGFSAPPDSSSVFMMLGLNMFRKVSSYQ